jgi:hypothetical protein
LPPTSVTGSAKPLTTRPKVRAEAIPGYQQKLWAGITESSKYRCLYKANDSDHNIIPDINGLNLVCGYHGSLNYWIAVIGLIRITEVNNPAIGGIRLSQIVKIAGIANIRVEEACCMVLAR